MFNFLFILKTYALFSWLYFMNKIKEGIVTKINTKPEIYTYAILQNLVLHINTNMQLFPSIWLTLD